MRFDDIRNKSFVDSDRVADDWHETWYTKNDYNRMRKDVLDAAQQLRTRNRGMKQRQEYSFFDILEALSKLSGDFAVEDASSIQNAETRKVLSQLYARGQNPVDVVGLESYLDIRLLGAVKEHRACIHDVVNELQEERRAGILSDEESLSELRESCLHYSQAFGLLAQLLATAQLAVN